MEDKNETCDTTLQLGFGIGVGVGKYVPFVGDEEMNKKKKDRVSNGDHHHEFEDYVNNKINSNHNKNGAVDDSGGKKLKLTKEQSTLLEQSFNLHNTLSLVHKQELADKLNLKPRQVEVWFQNRRARTKLKQTEVDCEVLKKCCENLSSENKRLKKEVQELRSVLNFVQTSPFYIQASKATMLTTICPFEVKNNDNKSCLSK